jgi:hypothetical protein
VAGADQLTDGAAGLAPYRECAAPSRHQAASRDGQVALEIGPRHLRLELGPRFRLTVAGSAATWVRQRSGGDHRRELPLGQTARLWATRSFPTRDLALWYECRPGQVERLGGVRAVAPFEADVLAAWRGLDRLADELGSALLANGGNAVELGRGHHRVLLAEQPGRLLAYARPLFRERPRHVLEVGSDGSLVVPGRARPARFASRDQVAASGDRVCFTTSDGRTLVSLWLPWIAVEDRRELARRFAEHVDPAPPEPDYEPRTGPRPWLSGLGRAPLPRTLARR